MLGYSSCMLYSPAFAVGKERVARESPWLGQTSFGEKEPASVPQAPLIKNKQPQGELMALLLLVYG